jgi:23S rRNA pseudouridine1911/1915/1917 synthase
LLGGIEQLLAFEIENGGCPAIVNRLDRDTSGLVLVAKHKAAARELGMIFERRGADKEYLAIVHGWPEQDSWISRDPILRAGELGPSDIWVRQVVNPAGRECATDFHVETRFKRGGDHFARVRCHPYTGRTHQIRVHLAAAGHAIVGDKIYSGDGSAYHEWMANGWSPGLREKLLLPRHALHAAVLRLKVGGREMEWDSPLPADLADFCEGKSTQDAADVVIWSRHD